MDFQKQIIQFYDLCRNYSSFDLFASSSRKFKNLFRFLLIIYWAAIGTCMGLTHGLFTVLRKVEYSNAEYWKGRFERIHFTVFLLFN